MKSESGKVDKAKKELDKTKFKIGLGWLISSAACAIVLIAVTIFFPPITGIQIAITSGAIGIFSGMTFISGMWAFVNRV